MRKFVLAALVLGAAHSAHAADLPDFSPVLRGAFPEGLSSTRVVWQGYYVGGQVGYGWSDVDLTNTTTGTTARALAGTIIQREMSVSQWGLGIGRTQATTTGFGGFAGYNSQWDDIVIGLEGSYLHGNFGASASGAQRRVAGLSDNYLHDVTSQATSSIAIQDIATFRGRAGYMVGAFLPYVFGGLAIGSADITRTASIQDNPTYTRTPVPAVLLPPSSYSLTEADRGKFIYGYSAGLGVDVNLMAGLFLRAEWEYIQFTSAPVETKINTVRAGLGYKF